LTCAVAPPATDKVLAEGNQEVGNGFVAVDQLIIISWPVSFQVFKAWVPPLTFPQLILQEESINLTILPSTH
jgi:hypothetical protein